MHRTIVALIVAAGAAATARTAAAKCDPIDCGTNNPLMLQYQSHEGHEGGQYNDAGLKFTGLWVGGVWHQLDVLDDQILGRDTAGNIVVSGTQVVGGYIAVESNSNPPIHIRLYIDQANENLKVWVDPGDEVYWQYVFSYIGGNMEHNLPMCPDPPPGRTKDPRGDVYPNPTASIVFDQDRYHAFSKRVIDTNDTSGWFNIACAGNAPYKLFMTRHTTVTSNASHQTTRPQRQAMLKMYVSDVCGTGDSFTVQQTPLVWNNGLQQGSGQPGDTVESLWGEGGALCQDTHRWGAWYLPYITAACPKQELPPACSTAFPTYDPDLPTTWPSNAYVISRLPGPPPAGPPNVWPPP